MRRLQDGQVAAALDVLLPNLLPELRGEVFEIAKLSADQIAFRFGQKLDRFPPMPLALIENEPCLIEEKTCRKHWILEGPLPGRVSRS